MSKHFGIDGIGSDVQLGKAGGRFIYDGSNYKFTLSDGSTLETVQGADPVGVTDFTTKAYVDAASAGLDPKESCRVATTTDPGGTYSPTGGTGGTGEFTLVADTIDGISLSLDDRILVKDDTTQTQNGIYKVTTVGTGANGVWERAEDHDGSPAGEVSSGNYTFIEQGTANANDGWVLQGDGILTLNTDNIIFVQFSGSGTFLGGIGITLNSPDFDLDFNDGSMSSSVAIATGDLMAFADISVSDTMQIRTFTNMLADLDIVNNLGGNGIAVQTSADNYTARSIAVSGVGNQDGLAVSNGDGVSANPTIGLDINGTPTLTGTVDSADTVLIYDSTATANVKESWGTIITDLDIVTATVNGILVRTGEDSYASRTLTASSTATEEGIIITNGDGISADPTIGLDIEGTTASVSNAANTDSLLIFDGTNNREYTVTQLANAPAFGGGATSIADGDSSVSVTDAGTGLVDITVDAESIVTVNVSGMTITSPNTLTLAGLTADRIVYTTTGGEITNSANYTYNGTSLALTGDMTITGDLSVDNININLNTITSTDTNGNINLDPDGTGIVTVASALQVNSTVQAPSVTNLTIISGISSSGTDAGDLLLQGGDNSSTGAGGSIILTPGSSTSGTKGTTIVQDEAGNEVVEFLNGTSAINHISILAGATGVAPIISTNVTGAGTDVDLSFTLKGTGVLAVVAGSGNYEDNVTADDDIPNKIYVDNAISTAASGQIGSSTGTVDFTSATAQNIGTLPANAVVLRTIMDVDTASDAVTTTTIGDATNGASSYMAANENDPEAIDVYIAAGYLANGAGDRTIQATVATAGTVGSATVIVEWRIV